MNAMTLQQVAELTHGECVGDPGTPVRAVATDSRELTGSAVLFVALRGEHADGHAFIGDAVARGAAAVLSEHPPEDGAATVPHVVVRDCWRALAELATHVRAAAGVISVAVTGSVGKTTVKDLTAAALSASRRVHAAAGSHNNELGVPLTVLNMPADTEVLVAEIGARHVGDIAALAPIVAPDIAIVTAVAGVHLEVFGSIEAVAATKSELVRALGPGGVAVLNVADPRVAAMQELAPRAIRVSPDDASADVYARGVRLDEFARVRATAVTPWGVADIALGVAGRHHLTNALLALAVAGELGVGLRDAADAIASATVSPWRAELARIDGVTLINDAYNANPTSVLAALDTLAAVGTPGRRIAVLGEMAEIGADSHAEHRRVGSHCVTVGVDDLIVVGGAAAGIAEGAERFDGGDAGSSPRASAGTRVHRVSNPEAAARELLELVTEGDVVLVKASRVAGLESVATALETRRHRQTQ